MLKIKDNVDLKELEKFGFKKHKKDGKEVIKSLWYKDNIYSDDLDGTTTKYCGFECYSIVDILVKNREVIFLKTIDASAIHKQLDIMHELTKADLVEKVENE